MVIAVNKRPPAGRHGGLGIKGNGKLANDFSASKSQRVLTLCTSGYIIEA